MVLCCGVMGMKVKDPADKTLGSATALYPFIELPTKCTLTHLVQ